ncbi:MAG: rane-associated phospholipid phosphatase [Frankiales bacterium]|nr:rane-associated phospholipid phosphatase [Frankiales bacterium]
MTAAHDERAGRRTSVVLAVLVATAVTLWALATLVGTLLTHAWRSSALVHWDASVDADLARHRTGWLNTVSHVATYGAETVTVVVIALIGFVLIRWRLGRWTESLFLAAAVAGEVIIFVATTMIVNRSRPAVLELDQAPPTSSFPSGHTAASVAIYGALAIIALHSSPRRWLRIGAVALAVLMPIVVALSRLYRGMHYPSDVIAAAVLSTLWLTATSAVLLRGRPTTIRAGS